MDEKSEEERMLFAQTLEAPPQPPPSTDCGVRTTSYPCIKNAPLPADGPGSDSFSNYTLIALLALVPAALAALFARGPKTWIIFPAATSIPILMSYWYLKSLTAPRRNTKVAYPSKPISSYITFERPQDQQRYANKKIPIETFHQLYFDGLVHFNGDALDMLEMRHDWASFQFTLSLFKFFFTGMIPEVILHSRSQDEEQVRGHYDRGDDFYAWFLGPRMIYTSGIISDITREESLEEMQDNKLRVVCEKIGLQQGESLLDIGCGWGTLARYASRVYGAKVTGITLGRNQTKWGNEGLARDGIPASQSKILCSDYRDIPDEKFDKITCLEMAEHVGVRHFGGFLRQVNGLLNDDGVFFLQIAGLRKYWQYEDLVWGLFMNRYIFPGADASTPLGFVIDSLEGSGFEVKSIDTIGVHYSATLWHWYRNWLANKDKVVDKYGVRWYRIWEFFLAWSTIISRQGSATCYQITLVKNINSTHRVEGIDRQFGLKVGAAGK